MAVFQPISHVVFIPESGTQFEITESINYSPLFYYTLQYNHIQMIDMKCIVDKFKTPKRGEIWWSLCPLTHLFDSGSVGELNST